MTTGTSWALQVALFDRLTAQLPVPVYDDVPDGAAYPYVTIGDETTTEQDSHSATRTLRLVTLSVWSDAAGQQEVKGLVEQIKTAIHRVPLPLAAGRLVHGYVQRSAAVPDADGRTYTGQVTYQATTEP